MKRFGTILLSTCLVSVWLLFAIGSPVLAQAEKGEEEKDALRKQEQALRKQVEELTRQLDEVRNRSRGRQEAAEEAPGPVDLGLELEEETDTAERMIGILRRHPRALGEVVPPPPAPTPRVSAPAIEIPSTVEAPPAMRLPVTEPRPESIAVLPTPSEKRGIELRRQELERVMHVHGDAGLVTLLRFEKARVCRKAGMYEEAVQELQKIIEENLADETTNAARWTLVEIFQEQKRTAEAIAELEKIFISASDTQDRMDAIYGIINLSGEGPKARIQAIDRLIQALLTDQANWNKCMGNLKQLHAAEQMYAQDHDGRLSEKLSDLYPDYVDNLEVFTCPASGDPKITRKEDIDSLTSYVLVAKGQPAKASEGESVSLFPDGGRSRERVWIREKEPNHGRRRFYVYSDGRTGWSIGPPPLL
jgi:tetratricopeptide (TPR) repeat protein